MALRIKTSPDSKKAAIHKANNLINEGDKLFCVGKLEAAHKVFVEALQLHPESIAALNNLAVLFLKIGEIGRALNLFVCALDLEPDNVLTVRNYSNFLKKTNRTTQAATICSSYLEKHPYDTEIASLLLQFTAKNSNSHTTLQQVVFVSDQPRAREAKLAYGLKQAGWEVILLHKHPLNLQARQYYSQCHQYKDIWEALSLSFNFTPYIYHVFSNWFFETAAALIRLRPGKIVFDDYDVLAGMVKEQVVNIQYPGQLELERFCLENADGLCCRSLETQYAKRFLGYHYSGRRIFFPDYCWNKTDYSPIKNKERFTVTAVGNLYMDHREEIGHSRNFHLRLALELSQQNVICYFYKSNLSQELVSYIEKLSPNNQSLVIKTSEYEVLIDEITKNCHAGLICAPPHITKNMNEIYRQTKREFAIGNKAFDYVDADLQVIIDEDNKFLRWFIKRYSEVIDMNEFMNNIQVTAEKILIYFDNHKNNLKSGRQSLSVLNHVRRLIRFYENV